MGSQTQISLSDIQERKKTSQRHSRKNGRLSAGVSSKTKDNTETEDTENTPAQPPSIRPTFLSEQEGEAIKKASASCMEQKKRSTRKAERKTLQVVGDKTDRTDEPDAIDAPAPAEAAPEEESGTSADAVKADSTSESSNGGDDDDIAAKPASSPVISSDAINKTQITDPELISLLEQLSQTIDTANQVLSETPEPHGVQHNEYAGINASNMPLRPPAAPTKVVKKASYTLLKPGLAATFAGLFLLASGGSYYLFKANPWLRNTLPGIENAALSTAAPALDIPSTPPLPLQKPSREEATALTAPASPEKAAPVAVAKLQPAPAAAPVANEKPIEPDAPHGQAGQPIALGLTVPARTDGHEISVMVQGVPENVKLSAGNKIGGGTWILNDKQAVGLTLVTPRDFAPQTFSLEIALVKSDGKIPESRSIDIRVVSQEPVINESMARKSVAAVAPDAALPGATPLRDELGSKSEISHIPDKGEPEEKTDALTGARPPAPKPERQPTEEEKRFIAKAEKLLKLSDVASARLVLEYAARSGSIHAMTMLAKTYDPEYLASLGVRGVKGDKAQATAWYERASRKADR